MKKITIKDVAALAGVSIGSVSNVLNGKTSNASLIEKVEKAIAQSGFVPDSKGRILKGQGSKLVGVIIDDYTLSGCGHRLSGIDDALFTKGFSSLVVTVSGNADLLNSKLDLLLEHGVSGIIIDSQCQIEDIKRITSRGISVIDCSGFGSANENIDCIKLRLLDAIVELNAYARQKGYKQLGLMLDKIFLKDYELVSYLDNNHIAYHAIGGLNQDAGFKESFVFLQENKDVDLVLLGSKDLVSGMQKALSYMYPNDSRKITLTCIKRYDWSSDSRFEAVVFVPNYEMGYKAGQKIVDRIVNKTPSGQIVTFDAKLKIINNAYVPAFVKNGDKLKLLVLDTQNINVISKLFPHFTKNTGIEVVVDVLPYHELWQKILSIQDHKSDEYDLIAYDILWKERLHGFNLLRDLSSCSYNYRFDVENYTKDIFEKYGAVGDSFIGVPLLTSTQMLFYQAHLFNDTSLKRQFKLRYGYDLKLPTTWYEFNQIAQFFTQSQNPNSPTKYGSAIVNDGNIYSSIEFINRLWSLGGRLLNQSKAAFEKNTGIEALNLYRECYEFCPQNKAISSFEHISELLKSGDIAMAVLYDAFAFGLNDPMLSKIAGNVDATIVPGASPVLGGWGIGVSSYSQHADSAFEFLHWMLDESNSYPISLLTGMSCNNDFFENSDLNTIYPWKSNILKSYQLSKERCTLSVHSKVGDNIYLYDKVLGQRLGMFLKDKSINAETCFNKIALELKRLTE